MGALIGALIALILLPSTIIVTVSTPLTPLATLVATVQLTLLTHSPVQAKLLRVIDDGSGMDVELLQPVLPEFGMFALGVCPQKGDTLRDTKQPGVLHHV